MSDSTHNEPNPAGDGFSSTDVPKTSWWTRSLAAAAGLVAGVATLFMMALLVADVVARALFSSPISGTVELVRVLLVLVMTFGFAYAELRKEHLRVELAVDKMPARVRTRTEVAAQLVSLGVVLMMVVQTAQAALVSTRIGETLRGLVDIPIWPVKWAASLGLGLLAYQILVSLIMRLAAKWKRRTQLSQLVKRR